MSSRAKMDHAEEGPMLIQAKISAPDTLLTLYVAIDENLKALEPPLRAHSSRAIRVAGCRY
jgi:hypothetical protein